MASLWHIELFGGLRARRGSGPVSRYRTQKMASLLAYLAYFRPRSPSREALIELLWPDDDPVSARHKLSVVLSTLRSQLEPAGVPDGAVLQADRQTVALASETVTTDVLGFDSALEAAERAPQDGDRVQRLAEAVRLYQGTLLAGFYDAWIFPEQQRRTQQFIRALRRLLELRERAGETEAALQIALQAVAADPLAEELHGEVMRLYLQTDQPAAALRQYRNLQQRLRQELDSAPSLAVHALAEAAQARMTGRGGPPSPAKRRPPGSTPRATGALPQEVPPAPAAALRPLEPVGGAVPLDSPFYVEREADAALHAALAAGDSIVLLKGPRQVGKTSLLARGVQRAREAGVGIALTDFQELNAAHLSSPEGLLKELGREIAEQLDLDSGPEEGWDPERGPNANLRRFFRDSVLSSGRRVVWAMDEVDRLFGSPFASEVFGMFRSWHNQRALNPSGPWSRLTLVIAYATEAHLFIEDIHQSPFNVGTRLALGDFTLGQVADLNRRYGSPLASPQEVERLYRLVGGQPFLVRLALHELAGRDPTARRGGEPGGASLEQLEAQPESDEGVFAEHLRRILLLLGRNPALCDGMREVLRGRPCPTLDAFYRLRSAGVLSGESLQAAAPRCRLYAGYLSRHLL